MSLPRVSTAVEGSEPLVEELAKILVSELLKFRDYRQGKEEKELAFSCSEHHSTGC